MVGTGHGSTQPHCVSPVYHGSIPNFHDTMIYY